MNRQIKPSSLITRGTKLSLTNIWRNKFLSLATTIVIAIIIFIFNIILAINITSQNIITEATQKIDLVVYLNNDIDSIEGETIAKEIEKLPEVNKVTFRSSQEALEIMRKESPRTIELLERNNISSPFPPDLKIITNSVEDHRIVLNYLQEKYNDKIHPLFNGVLNQHSNQLIKVTQENQRILSNVSENLLKFKTITNQIIYWTIFIFVIGGVLILMNAIQLAIFNRQNEIQIMKLVGATYNFIRFPYILEGIFYAIAAVILSAILIVVISSQIELTPLQSISTNQSLTIIAGELLITIILGIVSSTITVNRYLKKN